MTIFDPITYGATADGKTVDTKPIQAAIDAAYENGGGTVVFLSGKKYISGSLVIKSHVFLEMEAGSYLKASTVRITFRPDAWCILSCSDLVRYYGKMAW